MNHFSALPDPANSRHAIFADAAFGERPGIPAAELPAAADAVESWLRAVVLGGQGRYAAARAELGRAYRGSADPVLRSLITSTRASLLRQLGHHARAAVLDGRALALVPPDASAVGPAGSAARREAVCDALTGLAADALGIARPELSARLLKRCQTFIGDLSASADGDGARARLRWHWVSAETALAAPGRGLVAGSALRYAETALALAERGPSVRHRVKSRLLVAAAGGAPRGGGHGGGAGPALGTPKPARPRGVGARGGPQRLKPRILGAAGGPAAGDVEQSRA
ncbi:hypothetical protein, partial [Nocardia wallacei]|uniref:hypothetical protein n=1 Tax=Nocardia wallacei TaxID=480035 RepID=UPI002456B640